MSDDDMPPEFNLGKKIKGEFELFINFLYSEEKNVEKAKYNKDVDYLFIEKNGRYVGLCGMHKIEKAKDKKMFGIDDDNTYTFESLYIRPSFRK